MTSVLVTDEKHGNSYYDASTPELLAASALTILRDRFNDGYWYYEPKAPELNYTDEQKSIMELTDEEIANLPVALRASTEKQRNSLLSNRKGREREYLLDKQWYDATVALLALPAKEAVKQTVVRGRNQYARTVPTALDLLEQRNDYQYESFEIFEVTTPKI